MSKFSNPKKIFTNQTGLKLIAFENFLESSLSWLKKKVELGARGRKVTVSHVESGLENCQFQKSLWVRSNIKLLRYRLARVKTWLDSTWLCVIDSDSVWLQVTLNPSRFHIAPSSTFFSANSNSFPENFQNRQTSNLTRFERIFFLNAELWHRRPWSTSPITYSHSTLTLSHSKSHLEQDIYIGSVTLLTQCEQAISSTYLWLFPESISKNFQNQ